MRTLTRFSVHRPAEQAPVFADISGRRQRRMRRLGLGAGAALLACLVVMAVGLLGGPRASFIPWSVLGAAGTGSPGAPHNPHRAGSGATQPTPDPVTLPSPGSPPSPGRSSPAGSSTSALAAGSPSATSTGPVTNRATKTPPGLNRTPSPTPSHSHKASAI